MISRFFPDARALAGVAALLTTVAPSDGRAAEPAPRVAIVVETAVNLDDEARIDLSERVAQALRRALVVDVTAGREVARRLVGLELPADCYRNSDCVRKVAGLLEVDELLLLSAVRFGARLQIEPTWVDVASGRTVGRDALVSDSVKDDLSNVLRAAAPRLLPDAKLRPAPPAPPVGTSTASIAAVGPRPAPRGPPMPTWVAFGVAGVAAISAVAVGVSARADYDALESDGCAQTPCDPARLDRVDRKSLAADLLFATAGAAAITGAVWWWLDATEPAPIQTGPAVTGGGVGWMVGGRF